MSSARNLLKPSAGEPIITPTQDMVLGCYYLTKETKGKKGEGMVFTNIQEAVLAYQTGNVDIQSPIKCRHQGEIIETTVGRLIFNSFLPEEMPYLNEAMGKKKLSRTVAECFDNLGIEKTAKLADNLKHIGFKFATKSGISISQADMIVPDEKGKSIEEASEIVKQINNFYWKGLITDEERYNQTIKVWMQIKSSITKKWCYIDNENNIST